MQERATVEWRRQLSPQAAATLAAQMVAREEDAEEDADGDDTFGVTLSVHDDLGGGDTQVNHQNA
jgi:hypothetical protein